MDLSVSDSGGPSGGGQVPGQGPTVTSSVGQTVASQFLSPYTTPAGPAVNGASQGQGQAPNPSPQILDLTRPMGGLGSAVSSSAVQQYNSAVQAAGEQSQAAARIPQGASVGSSLPTPKEQTEPVDFSSSQGPPFPFRGPTSPAGDTLARYRAAANGRRIFTWSFKIHLISSNSVLSFLPSP